MVFLPEAKEKGFFRAHGCSCHSIEALRTATKSPWVEIHLVRINPLGAYMDSNPDTVVSVMREMRAAGKGIIGMKILGQGELRHPPAQALKFALWSHLLDPLHLSHQPRSPQ